MIFIKNDILDSNIADEFQKRGGLLEIADSSPHWPEDCRQSHRQKQQKSE
jgi:hypothetical protein